jgi:drug/metabolite transporter (DMT)-like permease
VYREEAPRLHNRRSRSDHVPTSLPSAEEPAEAASFFGGIVRIVLATMLWSSSALLIDQLTSVYHLTALQISTWRVMLVLPIVAGVIAIRRPGAFWARSHDLPWYIAAGIVGVTLSYVTWATSVHINKPAVAAAVSFSAPALVAIGDRLLFRTRLHLFQIGAIIVNLLGCSLAAGIHTPADLVRSPVGLLVGLSNGLAFAFYTLLGRGMARTGRRDALTALLYMFAFGALGLLVWGLPTEGRVLFDLHLPAKGWLLLVGLATGPTLLAYALFNSSLKDLPATVASLSTTLEPPLVAILAFFLLGRSIAPLQWIGIGLIVGAVVAMQLFARPHQSG